MRRPIAKLRINAGNPGWYDPLTNIHLTITRPEALVYEGFNTTNIKKGVACKLISVIDGDLNKSFASSNENEEAIAFNEVRGNVSQEDVEKPKVEKEKVEEPVKEPAIEEKVEETIEPEEVEEVKEVEEEKVEEPVEAEEVVEEEKPKKKTSTKKAKAKKEKTEE